MERIGTRQSKRIPLQVRLRVYGTASEKGAFREEARTLSISANGGLVALSALVDVGQSVIVVNQMTGEQQECRVAYVGSRAEGKTKIGIAFKNPAPQFWLVDFPRTAPAAAPAPAARAAVASGWKR